MESLELLHHVCLQANDYLLPKSRVHLQDQHPCRQIQPLYQPQVSLQLCLTLQDQLQICQLILASLLQASLLAPPLSFESLHHHQLSRSYFEEGAICAT